MSAFEMKNLRGLLTVLIGLLIFAGCSKKQAEAPQAAEPTPAAPAVAAPAAPKAARAPTAAAPAGPVEEVIAVHEFMTKQLHIFIEQKGRMPESFVEFTQARMDSPPRPPPGTKFVIDPNTVEVKLVKQ